MYLLSVIELIYHVLTVRYRIDKTVLDPLETESSMVKKFQRSSADHELRIPHLLRTVGALYRTISHMEDNIMERHLSQQTGGVGVGAGERDRVTSLFVSTDCQDFRTFHYNIYTQKLILIFCI